MVLSALCDANLDPIGWARRPRSYSALRAVIELARNGDTRFADILARLVEDEVCTASGRLMYRWDGGRWIRVADESRYLEAA